AARIRAAAGGTPAILARCCSLGLTPAGSVRHKYNPDGTLASSWHGYVRDGKPVLPIQEDETALIIWALWQYFELYQPIEETQPHQTMQLQRTRHFTPDHSTTAHNNEANSQTP